MAIGQSKQRLDAEAKVTGRARYTDDMGLPGMRHAAYVHSTIAHGMVLSIDASEALALPGVEAVFTADDVPGFLFPTAGHPYSMDPSHGDVADRLLLTKHVRYYGDEVAVVVARDGLTARKAAQTTMYKILVALDKIIAPILCFTGDEIWLAMPHKAGDDDRNVLFNDMNGVFADYALSADEMAKWEKIIEVRDAVNGALETARAEKKIGKSLEADVALTVPAEDAFLAEMDGAALADLLIVSKVEVTVGGELAVSVSEAAGTKCPRCWKHSTAADENGLCPRCASVIAKCADFGEV